MTEPTRQARASARRSTAVICKASLLAEEEDLSPVRGVEAVSLVTRLSAESWSRSGQEMPAYTRRETPIRFLPGFGA